MGMNDLSIKSERVFTFSLPLQFTDYIGGRL